LKPEVGMSVPAGRSTIDAYAGVWLFTTNHSHFPGTGTSIRRGSNFDMFNVIWQLVMF
jgi:hypothetical protein